MLRAQILVTDEQKVVRTYDGNGALFVAYERKFDKSVLEMAENPRLEHILWLGYEAVRRANQHDGLSFDQWLDLGYTVEFEVETDPLEEAATPTK